MNDTTNGQPDDVDLMLPWYVTGRLSAAERARIEAALEADAGLRHRLALVREELAETEAVNEALPTPPRASFDKLMAQIDLHEAEHPRHMGLAERLMTAISNAIQSLSPRTLAWSGVVAAAVICLQAALLTGVLLKQREETTYKTASADTGAETGGTYALVGFAGTASLQQVTDFLGSEHAEIIDGPKPGGFYRIKLSSQKLADAALAAKLAEFRAHGEIIRVLLPEPVKR
ncbi:MAG: hypothetical protein ACLP8A_01600 [Methylovirgula sp.]